MKSITDEFTDSIQLQNRVKIILGHKHITLLQWENLNLQPKPYNANSEENTEEKNLLSVTSNLDHSQEDIAVSNTLPQGDSPEDTVVSDSFPQRDSPEDTVVFNTLPQEDSPRNTAVSDSFLQEDLPEDTAVAKTTLQDSREKVMQDFATSQNGTASLPPQAISSSGV